MKRCPQCNKSYKDNSQSFCVIDGTPLEYPLTPGQAAPTLIISNQSTVKLKPKQILLILFGIGLLAAIILMIKERSLLISKGDDGEDQITIGEADVTLDLGKYVELDDEQLRSQPRSSALCHIKFSNVIKHVEGAKLTRRLGTTSNFKPEWRDDFIHKITQVDSNGKKCLEDVTNCGLLEFDLGMEKINKPFDLSCDMIYYNAHNGKTGDWHAFYVSQQTKKLVFKIIFPKNKPYIAYQAKSGRGGNLKLRDLEEFPNAKIDPGINPETGAQELTWTIDSPESHRVYAIVWQWKPSTSTELLAQTYPAYRYPTSPLWVSIFSMLLGIFQAHY